MNFSGGRERNDFEKSVNPLQIKIVSKGRHRKKRNLQELTPLFNQTRKGFFKLDLSKQKHIMFDKNKTNYGYHN